MSRNSNKALDTRSRILQTTARLLEAHDGRGVRMADIAKQCDISRQAVYLHFANRTELLTATTQFRDQELNLDARLAPSRQAASGQQRLDLYIAFWGNYVPQIYGIAKALITAQDQDAAAETAWHDRMAAHREGCAAVINALAKDGQLTKFWNKKTATDLLWSQLSVEQWAHLTMTCGWSDKQYIDRMSMTARRTFIDHG